MIRDIIYNYYYKQFIKENSKSTTDINWNKWNKFDKLCEKFSK